MAYFIVALASFAAGYIFNAYLGSKVEEELRAEKGRLIAELITLKKKL